MVSDDYVMGFVEGEGCFSVTIKRYRDYRPRKTKRKNNMKRTHRKFRVMPTFRLTISEEDNYVLKAIKEKFGFGGIYTQKRQGTQKNCSHYYVDKFENLYELAEFFKKQTFYTTKREDFLNWCKCLEIVKSGQHNTMQGLLEACEIREKMNRIANKGNRTIEEIKAIIRNNSEHIMVHSQSCIHNDKGGDNQLNVG